MQEKIQYKTKQVLHLPEATTIPLSPNTPSSPHSLCHHISSHFSWITHCWCYSCTVLICHCRM